MTKAAANQAVKFQGYMPYTPEQKLDDWGLNAEEQASGSFILFNRSSPVSPGCSGTASLDRRMWWSCGMFLLQGLPQSSPCKEAGTAVCQIAVGTAIAQVSYCAEHELSGACLCYHRRLQ